MAFSACAPDELGGWRNAGGARTLYSKSTSIWCGSRKRLAFIGHLWQGMGTLDIVPDVCMDSFALYSENTTRRRAARKAAAREPWCAPPRPATGPPSRAQYRRPRRAPGGRRFSICVPDELAPEIKKDLMNEAGVRYAHAIK